MPYPTSAAEPYLLVADDDAPTRCFLGDAFRQFGARVVFAANGNEALALARNETFDLLVLDCRMPGAGAVEILSRLRTDPEANSSCRPAVASSAELDIQAQQSLLATGFHAVLHKPCTLADLRGILALAAVGLRTVPVLDDGQALHTSGTPSVVQALRGLLRQELLAIDQELDELALDPKGLEARLHKLRSSCGFCGATSLSEHIVSLQQHLKLDHRGAMLPLVEFRRSMQETIDVLPIA